MLDSPFSHSLDPLFWPILEDMFNDIRQAVNLWLTTDIPDCLSVDLCDAGCEYVLLLLYHIADLLLIKVCVGRYHFSVPDLCFRHALFSLMHVAVELSPEW